MFTEDGDLKLIDFEFVRRSCGDKKDGLLHTKAGTSAYMAPEINEGKPY